MTRVSSIAALAIAALAIAAFAGLCASPALADPTRDDVMANVQRCAGITDNHVWLNCFYGAAQPMRAQLGLAPAPDSQVNLVKSAPVPAPPPMNTASTASKSSGGWFSGLTDIFDVSSNSSSDSEFSAGAMRMASYSYGKDGLFTVTLGDGEVWTQSKYDDLRAHWNAAAATYTVIVTNDMGSHTLRVKGDHDYRVMRIK